MNGGKPSEMAKLFKGMAIVFALTIIVMLFWYLPLQFSVYRLPIIGAITFILSLASFLFCDKQIIFTDFNQFVLVADNRQLCGNNFTMFAI